MVWASKPIYWSPKQPEYVTAYWRQGLLIIVFSKPQQSPLVLILLVGPCT